MKLPPRCPSVAVLALSLILGTPISLAIAQGVKNPGPPLIDEDQEQILSYWTALGGWHSELQLRNNLPTKDLEVMPVLRGPDGTETPLPAVTIKPQEVRSINLNIALNSFAPQLMGSYGSVALRYHSYASRALYAAIMVHDTGHPIAFHIDASAESSDYDGGSREGIWWLPNDTAKDILVLTNQGKFPLDLTVSVYDAVGKEVRKQIALGPRQSGLYSVRQIVESGHLTGNYGGIRVQAGEHGGSLDTLHAIYDEAAGFSALLKMFNRQLSAKIESRDFAHTGIWTQRAPMLALLNPDPALNFPAGTVLLPQIFVRNATGRKVAANLRFVWRNENSIGNAIGPKLTLNPFETRRIDVSALQSSGVLPTNAHWASVVLTSDGPPDELFAVTASYDSTLRYGAQTPFSDQLAPKWEGGQWEYDPTHDSIITAGNGGTKPTLAAFTIFYNQGKDTYDLEQTLQPDEQMWIDVGKLIREQIPDKNGKTLPPDLTSGSYRFLDRTSPGVGSLFEGKVIYDKTFGHVAYGCSACCGAKSVYLIYDPFYTLMGPGYTNGVDMNDSCGDTVNVSADFFNWSTANSGVATTTKQGTHTGVSIGSTTSNTSGEITEYGFKYCPQVPEGPNGQTNVASLSCTTAMTRGSSATCTVSGPSGTTVSDWIFTDASGNTVARSSNTGSLTWTGIIVTGGTVKVAAGKASLSASITVNNRSGFAFTAVSPAQSSGNSITCNDGTTTNLPSPPAANSAEGFSCANMAYGFNYATVNDGGPNNGYEYVTSASNSNGTNPTAFNYIVVSDLLSGTTFYNAQCGNFSSSNAAGFIAGSQLKQNVFDHEIGSVLSHWTEYVNSQNNSSNNIGTVLESTTAPPGSTGATFAQNAGNAALSRIAAAVANEPCSGSVAVDSSQSCAACGAINYSPYTACSGQPVPFCN